MKADAKDPPRRARKRPIRRAVLGVPIALCVLLLAGCGLQKLWWESLADRFHPPGRLVDVGGRSIHLVCEGEGSPTVLMDAGGTHDSTQYLALVREIGKTVRACAYDRAGMGWSDPSSTPKHARALTDDLGRLLDSAALSPPYVLVGSSAGGMTVELYAREHPDEVAGLVLLDALSGAMVDGFDDQTAELRNRACLARILNRVGFLRLLDPLDRREPRALALTYRNQTWDAICALTRAFRESAEQIRAAPPLADDIPLSVVTRDPALGSDDDAFETAWHAAQAASAARSSRSELIVATFSGHHITEDRPDVAAQAILRVVEMR